MTVLVGLGVMVFVGLGVGVLVGMPGVLLGVKVAVLVAVEVGVKIPGVPGVLLGVRVGLLVAVDVGVGFTGVPVTVLVAVQVLVIAGGGTAGTVIWLVQPVPHRQNPNKMSPKKVKNTQDVNSLDFIYRAPTKVTL